MKALIDSKELAVGAWVRTDGEIARITSLYKHNGELVAEGKLYDPIPVTTLLLEKNGWVKDKTGANAFTHPQLGSDNKIVIKDDVPVFHDQKVLYVHQLQNVLHEHNENISIHLQLFKI